MLLKKGAVELWRRGMRAFIVACAAGYVSFEGLGGARVSAIEESPASAGTCKHPLCHDLGVQADW